MLRGMKRLQTAPKGLLDTIHGYAKALQESDADVLERLLADDYTEVSPLGELDSRAKVIQSYRDQARQGRPNLKIAVEEPQVRTYERVALVVVRLTMTFPSTPARSIRTVLVARIQAGNWRLCSVQFTPIRTTKP